MNRVAAGVAAAGAGLVTTGVLMPSAAAAPHPHHARSVAPTAVAWYDETRPTALAPKSPKPGVGPHQLLVEGVTLSSGQLPAAVPTQTPTLQQISALAALRFHLPRGASAGTLALSLTGLTTASVDKALPSGVSPVACPTTKRFHAGMQQPTSAIPSYDCDHRSVVGQLSQDGSSVQFPGIGRLAHGRRLSLVVLPGTIGFERLVFAAPKRSALSLLTFDGGASPPTPTPTPTPQPTKSSTSATSPAPSSGGSAKGITRLPPLPARSHMPKPSSQAPDVASPATPPPTLQASAADPLDSHHARTAALALLVALVAATGWLAATDRSQRVVGILRIARAVRAGEPLPEITAQQWGVGRFRSARHGRPPEI